MDKKIYLASPHMCGKELEYINEAFETNWIAPLGPNVNKFEKEICKYTKVKTACALSSGTSAIHLALKSLNIKRGDKVFCSTLTFSATVNPIIYEQGVPVFIDSEYESFNMCSKSLEKAFESAYQKGELPKAVIVVHLYGQSADMDKIKSICDKYNTPIIEDAAESLGTTYKGIQTGTIGEIGIYSFNGNKIITTSGGGMIISNQKEHTEKALFWATQSREKEIHYEHKEIGYNYRMSNVVAGIGIGQLTVLGERILKKKEIYTKYKEEFKNITDIEMMNICEYNEPNYWLSVMTIKENSFIKPIDIINALSKVNIESRPVWKPMHLQPVFKDYAFYTIRAKGSVSEDLFNRGICLPSDTKMTENDINRVISSIKELFENGLK